mgnify:CR=1 FL=1
MKIDKIINKRFSIFILSSIVIIIICVLATEVIKNSDFVNKNVQVDTGNLQIIYKNGTKTAKKSGYPMSFQQGREESNPNIIEIVNKKDFSTSFSLCVRKFDVSSEDLSLDKMYFDVNNSSSGILSVDKECFYSTKVDANERLILNVRIWPGSDLISNEDQGKNVNLEFYVK